MRVEVQSPQEFVGDVIGDLSRRRGVLQAPETVGMDEIVHAEVPLAEMFGYSTDLRSATQGRASYTMAFLKYNEVPAHVAERIAKEE